MATATATTLTHGDALALLAAAMCAAQEQATEGDGEPGGAEMEIKALAELAGDPEGLMNLLGGGAAVAESVRPNPEQQTRRVKTIQRDPLTGFITGIVDTVELVESVAPGLLESAPGPPPRPGLVFDESSHRWTRPDKGDSQSSDKPEKAAPAKAAPHQSAAPTKASAAARRKPGDSFHDGMTGTLAKLKAGEIDPGDVEDAVGKLAQDYADAIAAHAEGFADHGVESMDSTFGSAITEHPESEAAISDFRYACESASDYIVAEANRLQDAAKTIADAHWEEDADMIAEADAGFAAASKRFQSAREAYRGRLKDAADELSRNLNNAVDVIAAPAVEVADELNSDTYGGPDDPDAAADAAKANAELEAAGNPFRVYLDSESGEWTYAVPDDDGEAIAK